MANENKWQLWLLSGEGWFHGWTASYHNSRIIWSYPGTNLKVGKKVTLPTDQKRTKSLLWPATKVRWAYSDWNIRLSDLRRSITRQVQHAAFLYLVHRCPGGGPRTCSMIGDLDLFFKVMTLQMKLKLWHNITLHILQSLCMQPLYIWWLMNKIGNLDLFATMSHTSVMSNFKMAADRIK